MVNNIGVHKMEKECCDRPRLLHKQNTANAQFGVLIARYLDSVKVGAIDGARSGSRSRKSTPLGRDLASLRKKGHRSRAGDVVLAVLGARAVHSSK